MNKKALTQLFSAIVLISLVSCGDTPTDCCTDPNYNPNQLTLPSNLPPMSQAPTQESLDAAYQSALSADQIAEDLRLIAYYTQSPTEDSAASRTALARAAQVAFTGCTDSIITSYDTLDDGRIKTSRFEYYNPQGQLQGACASGETFEDYIRQLTINMDGYSNRGYIRYDTDTSVSENGSYGTYRNTMSGDSVILITATSKSLTATRINGSRGEFSFGMLLDYEYSYDPHLSETFSERLKSSTGSFQMFFFDGRYLCAGNIADFMGDANFSCALTHNGDAVGSLWFFKGSSASDYMEVKDMNNQLVLP